MSDPSLLEPAVSTPTDDPPSTSRAGVVPTGLSIETARLLTALPGSFLAVDPTSGTVLGLSDDLAAVIGPAGAGDATAFLTPFVTPAVASALRSVARSGSTESVSRVRVVFGGSERHVDVTIRPLGDGPLALVRLDDATGIVSSERAVGEADARARAADDLRRSMFDLLHLGVVYQDRSGAILEANPAALEILGAERIEQLQGLDSHDPDWEAIDQQGEPLPGEQHAAIRAMDLGRSVSGAVMGIARRDGTDRRWLRVAATPRIDDTGDVVGVYSVFEDITDLRRLEQLEDELESERQEARLSRALQAVHDPMILASPVVNHAGGIEDFVVEALTGSLGQGNGDDRSGLDAAILDELVGRRLTEVWPGIADGVLLARCVDVVELGVSVRLEAVEHSLGPGGRTGFADVNATEVDGRLLVIWRDVTERIEQEHRLRQAERLARLARWVVDGDEVRFSSSAASVLGHVDDDALHDRLGPRLRSLVAQSSETLGPIEVRVADPAGLRRDVVVTGERESTSDGRRWTGTLQDVTRLRAAERAFAREHQVADALQRAMAPEDLPSLPGVDVAARYESASGATRVGGDWYDVVDLGDRFVVFVGDVAGHGLGATEAMVQLRQWSRLLVLVHESPARLLAELNRTARRFLDGGMATALAAVVDPAAGRIRWATAGHPPMAIRRAGDAVVLRHGQIGPPIGVVGDWPGQDQDESLDGVDALVLFTDGLVERRGEVLDVGFERLAAALAGCTGPASAWCDSLMDEVVGTERSDDACVVVIRRDPADASPDRSSVERSTASR